MGGDGQSADLIFQTVAVPVSFRYGLEAGYDIRTVQEVLAHHDVKTTMIDTHALNRSSLAKPGGSGFGRVRRGVLGRTI